MNYFPFHKNLRGPCLYLNRYESYCASSEFKPVYYQIFKNFMNLRSTTFI